MSRIELNIVALGDFSGVNAQIKALQAQVNSLNKSLAGVGISSNLSKDLAAANAEFKSTMLSTGQFTATTVKMRAETEKFGAALVAGKLKLSDYFNIITGKSSQATASLRALALEQVKLQNSIVMTDPTKRGVLSVYTPTQINKVAEATKIARMQQNMYNLSLEASSKAVINWGKNTQWAGRQLTVGLTMPMVMFGASATKTFQQVNDELVRLQKVYGTGLTQPTQKVLDDIKKQTIGLAKELASTMGIAAKDTAAMAADIAATGRTGNDMLMATREAMRLSKLGEMDTQSAMQTTISLQNVYKLNTQQLSGAIDFLNAVENQTSTSLQDLAAGIPKVGPIVQQLGGSFKDTAVMMVAMKEAGVPAAQSANAIKSALASLINPTTAAQKAFAAYNIDLKSIATKTGGNPIQMIMMLQGALKGLAPLAQAQLIEKLFGKYQEARIQALITNLGAVNSQTKTAFDLVNASAPQLAAIAAGELKTATESTTGKFKRAVETIKADLIPIGEKFMQVATMLLKIGDGIGKAFGSLPGPIKFVLGLFAGGAALAGPMIMLTGLMANFAGYLLKGVYNLRMLASGGKSFRELLTPEIIASQQAAHLFGSEIVGDVAAIDLLNGAISKLTVTLEALNATMNVSAGGLTSTLGKVEVIAANAAGAKLGQRIVPGFQSGIVPGSGSGDIYPAMLEPGESVMTRAATQQFGPVLRAMNAGRIPGHQRGEVDAGQVFNQAHNSVMDSRFANNEVIDTANWKQLQENTGHSFPVHKIFGRYIDSAGHDVVVKPMLSANEAIAETTALKLAETMGLKVPQQEIKVFANPMNPGQRLLGVVSPYDASFASKELQFNGEELIRQLHFATTTGNMDLQSGNLNRNILTDVGNAGVFSRASSEGKINITKDSLAKIISPEDAFNKIVEAKGTTGQFSRAAALTLENMSKQDIMNYWKANNAKMTDILGQMVLGQGPMGAQWSSLTPELKLGYENLLARTKATGSIPQDVISGGVDRIKSNYANELSIKRIKFEKALAKDSLSRERTHIVESTTNPLTGFEYISGKMLGLPKVLNQAVKGSEKVGLSGDLIAKAMKQSLINGDHPNDLMLATLKKQLSATEYADAVTKLDIALQDTINYFESNPNKWFGGRLNPGGFEAAADAIYSPALESIKLKSKFFPHAGKLLDSFKTERDLSKKSTGAIDVSMLPPDQQRDALLELEKMRVGTYTNTGGGAYPISKTMEKVFSGSSKLTMAEQIALRFPRLKFLGLEHGTTSVPGAGSGDTVPAMLTPGEAVIPAATAQANPEIINALVNGKTGIAGAATTAIQDALPGLETAAQQIPKAFLGTVPLVNAAGVEIGNGLISSAQKAITSNGAEMHKELLAIVEEQSKIVTPATTSSIATQQELDFKSGSAAIDAEKRNTVLLAAEKEKQLIQEEQFVTKKASIGSKFYNKNSGMSGKGMMAGMGLTMAGGMVSQIGGGNNEVAKAGGSAMSLAGMALMIPGVGAPVAGLVAGLSLAYSGFKHLMDVEKEHKAQAAAAFEISTTALDKYKTSIDHATGSMELLNAAAAKSKTPGTATTNKYGFTQDEISAEYKRLVDLSRKNKNDTEALQFNKVSGMTDSSGKSQVSYVTNMAETLIAQGADVGQVKADMQKFLAVTGQGKFSDKLDVSLNKIGGQGGALTSYVNAGLGSDIKKKYFDNHGAGYIGADLGGAATGNYLTGDADAAVKKIVGAHSGVGLENTIVTATSMEVPLTKVKTILDGLSKSALNSESGTKAVAVALQAAGGPSKDLGDKLMALVNIPLPEALKAMRASAVAESEGASGAAMSAFAKAQSAGKETRSFLEWLADPKQKKLLDEYANKMGKIIPPVVSSGGGGGGGTIVDPATALEKKYKNLLDNANKRITAEQKTLDLLNAQNDASSKALDYSTSMSDMQNQIKQKIATGDYLGANLLRQQMYATTDKYNMAKAQDENKAKVDTKNSALSDIRAQITSGKDLTSSQIKQLKSLGMDNIKFQKYNMGSVDVPASMSIGNTATLGSSSSNQTMNLTVNLSGVSDPKAVWEYIQTQIKTANAKNGTTYSVGGK
jgi:TP901 family phage tail tape measure protein